MKIHNDVEKVLLSQEEIKEICEKLGKQITKDYEGKELLVVGILKGCVVFFSDLIRNIDLDFAIDFMVVSSYGNTTESSGMVQILKDLSVDIKGKNLLVVEDIVDSGVTLSNVKKVFLERGAANVKICTFLDKPARRKADITVDYIGCSIPDEFVIGYGLDYAEKYRNLPYLAVLKRQVYEK